jgi:hypothetical protein
LRLKVSQQTNSQKQGPRLPKAYWVVTYRSMKNPEAWQVYAKIAGLRLNRLEGASSRGGTQRKFTRQA